MQNSFNQLKYTDLYYNSLQKVRREAMV
jgi:hypothetical protein